MSYGFVSLVGAGPGAPDLITVKGLRRLQAADVVVYDALISPELLDEARPEALRIPAGKRAGQPSATQDWINATLVEQARAGRLVVRLKGGDPFVFGRGGEEAQALVAAGIAWEVVPGITSAIAAPAYAGIPVTHRACASSFTVVTGHEDPARPHTRIDWAALAARADTLVFLMGIGNLPHIAERLIAHGLDPATPAAVVRWGTTPAQETVTASIATIAAAVAAAGLKPPATLVVGAVAALRDELGWFDGIPIDQALVPAEASKR